MWRSSSARTRLRASSFCPSAGSSRGHSPGSIVAEGWPRIGNVSTERRSPSSASPPSASCYENSAIQDNVPGQTLRTKKLIRRLIPPEVRHERHKPIYLGDGLLHLA